MKNLCFEAYAETYGNDEVANMVEQHHLKNKSVSSSEEYPTSKGSNLFLQDMKSNSTAQ